MISALLRFAIAALSITVCSVASFAACQINGANAVVISSAASVVVPTAYNPYSPSDLVYDVSVTITNAHSSKDCNFGLSFTRSTLPAVMTNGGSTMQYSIEKTSGGSLLQTVGYVAGSSPASASRLDGYVARSSSTTLTVRIRIAAGQTSVVQGTYADTFITAGLYEVASGAPIAIIQEKAFSVSATVTSACQLPAPDISSHDFSAAITSGLPSSAVVRTSTFTGVSCTQPARIRLSGSALQPTSAISTVAGFDNFINWQATGSFGAATATLSTATASTVTSTGYNQASGNVSGAPQ